MPAWIYLVLGVFAVVVPYVLGHVRASTRACIAAERKAIGSPRILVYRNCQTFPVRWNGIARTRIMMRGGGND